MKSPNQQQIDELSHLFTVRIWHEPLGNGQSELRGQVRHVLSGEVRYFREWPALIAYVTSKMGPDQQG